MSLFPFRLFLSKLNNIQTHGTIHTAWKVSKYEVISGPYLDTFHVVTVNIAIFSKTQIADNLYNGDKL